MTDQVSIETEIWTAKKAALMFLLNNYFVIPSPKPDFEHVAIQLLDHENKKPVEEIQEEVEDESSDEEPKRRGRPKAK